MAVQRAFLLLCELFDGCSVAGRFCCGRGKGRHLTSRIELCLEVQTPLDESNHANVLSAEPVGGPGGEQHEHGMLPV